MFHAIAQVSFTKKGKLQLFRCLHLKRVIPEYVNDVTLFSNYVTRSGLIDFTLCL